MGLEIYTAQGLLRADMTADEMNAAYDRYCATKNPDYLWASISPDVRDGIWRRSREQEEVSRRSLGWFFAVIAGFVVSEITAVLLIEWYRGMN
jgi:elongation factor P hydroxylase